MFITACTRALRRSLSWATRTLTTPRNPVSPKYNSIWPSSLHLDVPSGVFPPTFKTKFSLHFSSSPCEPTNHRSLPPKRPEGKAGHSFPSTVEVRNERRPKKWDRNLSECHLTSQLTPWSEFLLHKLTVSHTVKIFRSVVKPEGSLQFSQEHTIGFYTDFFFLKMWWV
jgi:hypothetical protein